MTGPLVPARRPPNARLRHLFAPVERFGWEYLEPPAVTIDPALETPPPLVRGRNYRRDLQEWEAARDAAIDAARHSAVTVPVWYPVGPNRTFDVVSLYGGTAVGWEAFLTTFIPPLLGAGALVSVIDLSERRCGGALLTLCPPCGWGCRQDLISASGSTLDLFGRLDGAGLVRLAQDTSAGSEDQVSRSAHQQDRLMLQEVVEQLADGPVTLDRAAAALRVVSRAAPLREEVLSPGEHRRLAVLYGASISQQGDVVGRATRLRAHLQSLRGFSLDRHRAAQAGDARATLRFVRLDPGDDRVTRQLAADLAIEALQRRLRQTQTAGHREVHVILGADGLSRDQVQALMNAAERLRLGLVLVFEHLRDVGAEVLGWGNGCALFMQLQNAEEAERAANHIGRHEIFKISQVTRTTGQTRENARGTTTGFEMGQNRSTTLGMSFARNIGSSMSRSQGTSATESFGTNASISTSESLSEELVVKVETLQSLPHTALLVVDKQSSRRVVLADCNPTILESHRVSTDPLRLGP